MGWINPVTVEGFLRFVAERKFYSQMHQQNEPDQYDPTWCTFTLPKKVFKHCDPQYNLARGCNTVVVRLLKYYRELESSNQIADNTEGIAKFEQRYDSEKIKIWDFQHVTTMPDDAYVFCTSSSKEQVFTSYPDLYIINDLNKFKSLVEILLKESFEADDFLKEPPKTIKTVSTKVRKVIYEKNFVYEGLQTGDPIVSNLPSGIDFTIWMNNIFRKPKSYKTDEEIRFAFYVPVDMKENGTKFLAFKTITKFLDVTPLRHEFDKIISLDI